MTAVESRDSYRFGPFVFDGRARELTRDGELRELGSRATDVLVVLLQADGALVTKTELMDRVWPGIAVEENNLQVQISILRRQLGDDRRRIQTVPGRGYRFVGADPAGSAPAARSDPDAVVHASVVTRCAPGMPSLVVLPFANLNADPALDYIVEGITDSLITDLSRALPGSFISSRSTALVYRGRSVDPRTIGRELGVRYVLEGSVLLGRDAMRVNAQLIDTQTGGHLWAERFDKPRHDILGVQNEIVARLARSVGLQVTWHSATLAERGANPDASDLTLRGRATAQARLTIASAEAAEALFRQALAIDPLHVDALVGLASGLTYQVLNFFRPDREPTLAEAAALVERALELAPDHLEALRTRGVVLRAQGEFLRAIAVARAVVTQNPGEIATYRELGLNHLYLGRFEDAVTWFTRAEDISPLDPMRWTWLQGLGRAYIGLEEDDNAVATMRALVDCRPGVQSMYALLPAALALAGEREQARSEYAQYALREPEMTMALWRSRRHVPAASMSSRYVAARERLISGLGLAGMPEE